MNSTDSAYGSTGMSGLREIAEVDGERNGQVSAGEVQGLFPFGPRLLHYTLHFHVVAVPVLVTGG